MRCQTLLFGNVTVCIILLGRMTITTIITWYSIHTEVGWYPLTRTAVEQCSRGQALTHC